jgi:hypothetical protein
MAPKKISKARFDALAFSRRPTTKFFVDEKEWYADQDENVLGVVTWDKLDHDWGYVVLGRDERSLFCAIEVDVSLPDLEMARRNLHLRLSFYSVTGEKIFPQGEETKRKKFEIFRLTVPERKLNSNFRMLWEGKGYSPAKEIIAEIAYSFEDPDGNYIQQFQTAGYDARLWELYLYAFLHENDFLIDRQFKAPDYLCSKYDHTVFIEAVTVNPTQENAPSEISPDAEQDPDQLANYAAIKFGSALYSKLMKRYWQLEHVKDKPLIFAIADFHQHRSMLWTHPYLMEYLYGWKDRLIKTEQGLQRVTESITEHVYHDKRIPSGYFTQPESENVSAVLFSNSGTISKFNRMGKLAGFGDPGVKMIRIGKRYDHGQDKVEPADFTLVVDEQSCTETWSEGVSIFHNPHAKVPVDEHLLPDAAHHYFRDGRLVSFLPEFFPMSSITQILTFTQRP